MCRQFPEMIESKLSIRYFEFWTFLGDWRLSKIPLQYYGIIVLVGSGVDPLFASLV